MFPLKLNYLFWKLANVSGNNASCNGLSPTDNSGNWKWPLLEDGQNCGNVVWYPNICGMVIGPYPHDKWNEYEEVTPGWAKGTFKIIDHPKEPPVQKDKEKFRKPMTEFTYNLMVWKRIFNKHFGEHKQCDIVAEVEISEWDNEPRMEVRIEFDGTYKEFSEIHAKWQEDCIAMLTGDFWINVETSRTKEEDSDEHV